MRSSLVFSAYAVALAIAPLFSSYPAHAATNVTLSQTIRPLLCTVDSIEVGADSVIIVLNPAQCNQSPAARELLAATIAEQQ